MKAAKWLILVLLTACGSVTVGPFVPSPAILCGADPDCPVGMTCRFPAVDTHPVCMDGESDIDSYPTLNGYYHK